MRGLANIQDNPAPAWRRALSLRALFVLAGLTLCVLWAYWPTFVAMEHRWSTDPQYSHGFLVPVFALVVLWHRRHLYHAARARPSAWGIAFLLAALVLRLTAARYYLEPLDGFSLLVTLLGICLLLGGWSVLRWSWPAIAFLGFMLPLPFQVDVALAYPLRRLATVCSTYTLQTLGFPAFADGNTILIEDLRLEVVNACSGLAMLVTFFALATAVAVVIERPILEKSLIVASAVPIALLANVVRISGTGVADVTLGLEAGAMLHDPLVAGLLMILLAMGLLGLELWFLSRLFVSVEKSQPLALGLNAAAGPIRPISTERVEMTTGVGSGFRS